MCMQLIGLHVLCLYLNDVSLYFLYVWTKTAFKTVFRQVLENIGMEQKILILSWFTNYVTLNFCNYLTQVKAM